MILYRPFGIFGISARVQAEKTDTQRTGDLAHLRQMRHQLARGLMHGFKLRAG
jgi:hypothetical protein